MFRFKTLFRRLLATYMAIVLFIILVFTLLSTQILRWNTVNAGVDAMLDTAETIAQYYEQMSSEAEGTGFVDVLQTRGEQLGLQIKVIGRYGEEWYTVSGDTTLAKFSREFEAMESEFLEYTAQGQTSYRVIYDDGLYATPVVCVAAPLTAEDEVVGSMFIQGRLTELDPLWSLLYSQLLISGGISIIVAFFLIYMTARRIEKPILAINDAAREIADGYFGKQLEIDEVNEIGQLAATFNTMSDALDKYEKTRSGFVANVSHELKSPMTSIQGFVQGILDGTIPREDENQYLEIVLAETKRLNVLIRDLLELSKMESGQFPLNIITFDVAELLRRILINFIGKIEDKKLEVNINVPESKIQVDADEDRIAQVLTNLIDNAVKFCPEGGELKIWLNVTSGVVNVSIGNTGSFIPEEDIPYVFDRFFKVDRSHNRNAPGTGIGLSIVKNIMAMHAQDVWVNSNRVKGTTFTFTLKQTGVKQETPHVRLRDSRRRKREITRSNVR